MFHIAPAAPLNSYSTLWEEQGVCCPDWFQARIIKKNLSVSVPHNKATTVLTYIYVHGSPAPQVGSPHVTGYQEIKDLD
jgi:hypothetical protein